MTDDLGSDLDQLIPQPVSDQVLIAFGSSDVRSGSRLFSNSGIDVKLSTLHLPGSLFSPQ
jgi:hypothetical protein